MLLHTWTICRGVTGKVTKKHLRFGLWRHWELVRSAAEISASSRNFFWDHFLKELRHQAQLGNQAFWWFNNSTLTSPDWLKCDWRGTGKETFLLLAREKTMGSYLLTICFCNFRGKEYYLISLRSVQIRIFCLWLKYSSSWILNTTHDQMEPKGISNLGNTCL